MKAKHFNKQCRLPLQMSTLEQTLARAGTAKCCEILDIMMTFTALPGVQPFHAHKYA